MSEPDQTKTSVLIPAFSPSDNLTYFTNTFLMPAFSANSLGLFFTLNLRPQRIKWKYF